ncbi:low temperature requirement protein A [Kutzneria sp. 744]|uniref:low temperature requirement protein A n=1 Tax=Kutzneria sp. (strain 744) TaxID=345341 RepID=UPI0003EED6E1|nr:low temperature requirement protein A [Kutzneria sp. 744]EWM15452.1 hypothetical protein KUTG_05756 [Kutzneria sp. 744]
MLLAVIWWMCGAYTWLTNAVPPRRTSTRALLVVAMVAYLVIVLVHTGLFPDRPGSRQPARHAPVPHRRHRAGFTLR